MTEINSTPIKFTTTNWLKSGYFLIGAILLSQICLTGYQASLSLHDNQKLAILEQEKQILVLKQAELDRTIAKETAIKPIQEALANEFIPMTKFLTATRHLTVASR